MSQMYNESSNTLFSSPLVWIIAVVIFILGWFIVFGVLRYTTKKEKQKESFKKTSYDGQIYQGLNDIVTFGNNESYFIHELLDFEKTIRGEDGDLIMRTDDNMSDVKFFIPWYPNQHKPSTLNEEEQIIIETIPSKPLTKERMVDISKLIVEAREYEMRKAKERKRIALYKQYNKANQSNERLSKTRTSEETLTEYNDSLSKEYEENEKEIQKRLHDINDIVVNYTQR